MWPFSKKWNAPAPQSAMVISLANEQLPSLLKLANPSGAGGAVPGMAGPADGKLTAENMAGPMPAGEYMAISPGEGACSLRVTRVDAPGAELSIDPVMLTASGLTEAMLAKFNRPAWRVVLEMYAPGNDVRATVIFATELAKRLAALGDGVVMDTSAYRFFGPNGWQVENPLPEFDAREHVHIHIESDSGWIHTHGLIKFGRPELEIYDVPAELHFVAMMTLFNLAQYVIATALVEPGQTCGDPQQPFYVRVGTKNQKGHWNGISVLELVDLNERQRPVSSGAPKALQHTAESTAGA